MILTLTNCVLLFLMILAATVFMPYRGLVKNFPEDVQERLIPRLDEIDKKPKAPRIIGSVIVILLCIAFMAVFVIGFVDGKNNGFSFGQQFIRSLMIAFGVKAFDIIGLDFILLTKTHFFQHFFPETEGCAGWKQFGYNRMQHLKQIICMIVLCGVFSFITSAIIYR